MTPQLKEQLLLRLFASLDYMETFTHHYVAGLQAADDAFAAFEKKYRLNARLQNQYALEIPQWRDRVIPNFQRMKKNALLSLDKAREGNLDYIEGATGNLRGLSKDMDGIGRSWWLEVDESLRRNYANNMNQAKVMGDNIYHTLSNFWNPGELLNEKITGPVDERELLKHLKPGESP